MRERLPSIASASPPFLSRKGNRLPELNISSSHDNPLPVLQAKQNDEDGMVTTVLPSILKGNPNPHGLEKCMTISVLDSKTQQDPAQRSRGRRRRPRVCKTEGSFDWLVDPVMEPRPPPTKPSQLSQSTPPFNGLVLTGHGIHQATSHRDDLTTSAPEEQSPPTSNMAKVTEKEHHVTFQQLPKHHRRHRCEMTDAFSVTGLTSMKEKQTLQRNPTKCCSGDTTNPQNQTSQNITYLRQRELPQKIVKAPQMKAVPILGGRRIIYNQPPTICSDVVPLPQLAPVVKGLNKVSRKLTTSPSFSQLPATKKPKPFLPNLSSERCNIVTQSQSHHQQLGEATTHKGDSCISPLYTSGLFQPRPPQQTLRASTTPRRFLSRGVGPDPTIRAKGRHE